MFRMPASPASASAREGWSVLVPRDFASRATTRMARRVDMSGWLPEGMLSARPEVPVPGAGGVALESARELAVLVCSSRPYAANCLAGETYIDWVNTLS